MKNRSMLLLGTMLVLYLANCDIASGHPGQRFPSKRKVSASVQISQPNHWEILYIRARTLFINGDLDEAYEAINGQIELHPGDEKSITLRTMIQNAMNSRSNAVCKNSRRHMLDSVDTAWKIEDPSGENAGEAHVPEVANRIEAKLAEIIIPQVRFMNLPISQAVEMITELSIKYDTTTDNPHEKGVNIVLLHPAAENEPKVTLNLRNISLERLLFYVSQAVNYKCNHASDAVVIGDERVMREQLETKFFPISRAAVIRLTGHKSLDRGDASEQKISVLEEEEGIKNFFVRAGVEFNTVNGSNMAFDGSQLIVTHTLKNLQRIGRILQKYSKTQQVEIEAKFLEVTQEALDELAFRWNLSNRFKSDRAQINSGTPDKTALGVDNLRTLAQTFSPSNASHGNGSIVRDNNPPISISNEPPSLPGQINIGTASVPFGSFLGVVDRAQINLMIRALEQKADSDLMSAPKLTVLSGKTASIVVAQELRYPQSYGETRSEVGTGSTVANSTSAGVTITAGTPRDFTTRNVGVEMHVTPTVESDSNISLLLEPKVTEFEGFMEYGGLNVAVTGGNTVYVPSGFYQPLFSTREIRTEVTVQNGWTVVMGGLTHEEIKEVHDKIPFLGDIPILGRIFRSKGETVKKRNLLIFVTARTVSPNGVRFQQPKFPSNFRSILSSQK